DSEQPSILYVGSDPALEYLLNRYAQRSGCQVRSVGGGSPDIDLAGLRPLSVWFSSLDVLAASTWLRLAAANLDIPLVVCAAVAGDARGHDLGADYIFLHPVTYDSFVSTLGTSQAS
ncbi:MAG: hypothetical protein ABI847_20715, partial [Anaerolineales bacterium]